MRGSSSGTEARSVLNLHGQLRGMQPWQAYLNKFQNMKLKGKIDDAWKQYLSMFLEGQKPTKTPFEIRNKLAQQLYKVETVKVKQKVEEHRKARLGVDNNLNMSDLAERNRSFQGYDLWLFKCIKLIIFFGEKCNQ